MEEALPAHIADPFEGVTAVDDTLLKHGAVQEADSSNTVLILDDKDQTHNDGAQNANVPEEKEPFLVANSISPEDEAPSRESEDAANKEKHQSTEDAGEEDGNESSEPEKAEPPVASPDSTSARVKSPGRKTPNLEATLKEAHEILGSKSFGRTRSQDRKRSSKRSSTSLKTASRKSNTGTPVSKRKRH